MLLSAAKNSNCTIESIKNKGNYYEKISAPYWRSNEIITYVTARIDRKSVV